MYGQGRSQGGGSWVSGTPSDFSKHGLPFEVRVTQLVRCSHLVFLPHHPITVDTMLITLKHNPFMELEIVHVNYEFCTTTESSQEFWNPLAWKGWLRPWWTLQSKVWWSRSHCSTWWACLVWCAIHIFLIIHLDVSWSVHSQSWILYTVFSQWYAHIQLVAHPLVWASSHYAI